MHMLTILTEKFRSALSVAPLRPHSSMNTEELERLSVACSSAFGETITPEVIELVANYCSHVGDRISGRCAGKTEDIVIRFLFRYYACKNCSIECRDANHIEIGVLFGAGVISAHTATRLAGNCAPIVAIDPFEGYYGASVDPVSKLEVTEQRFRENLAVFDIPTDDIKLVRGLSTDPKIIQHCRSYKARSLLIDGDHSYEGVLSDWKNYSPLVLRDGYVLVDDYNNPHWPEIARCVDKEILPNLRAEWVTKLEFGRSLLLQRVGEFPNPI
jgi:Methyltransferase domain